MTQLGETGYLETGAVFLEEENLLVRALGVIRSTGSATFNRASGKGYISTEQQVLCAKFPPKTLHNFLAMLRMLQHSYGLKCCPRWSLRTKQSFL